MNKEKLKKMLEDGVIDQKAYDELLKEIDSSDKGDDDEGKNKTPDIQALVQSAVDRATNKLGNENKELRKELEKLRKEKLSDDEVKKLELEEKLKTIEEKEKEIQAKELRMFAVKAMQDAGLNDGSDDALALVDILIGDDEESITSKTTTFKNLLNKAVESQVKQRFKDSGRDMSKGGSEDKKDDDDDKAKSEVAVNLAKETAENNKQTQSILDHYTGGKD